MKSNISPSRILAFSIIKNVFEQNRFSHFQIDSELSLHRLSVEDKALVTELVYGVLRSRRTLNYIIDHFLREKKIKISGSVRIVLQIALFQLLFLDRIPEYSLVSEAVEHIKKLTKGLLTSWANAVLRKAVSEKLIYRKEILLLQRSQSLEELSIGYSYELSLVKYFQDRYELSLDQLGFVLSFGNERSNLCLRVNTLKTSLEDFMRQYHFINFSKGFFSPIALRPLEHFSLIDFEGFLKGECSVQDEASQLIGFLVDPKPGEYILDCCSAPGGKAGHIQEMRKNKGNIVCFDRNIKRVTMGKENFFRLGIEKAIWVARDILDIENTEHYHLYDRVIVDAPCSAIGTVHRHPELKYMNLSQRLEICIPLQKQILEKVGALVKENGFLIYSVCSTTIEEGEQQIKAFLSTHKDFVIDTRLSQNECLKNFIQPQGFFQSIAHKHKIDGFFAVKLQKKKNLEM